VTVLDFVSYKVPDGKMIKIRVDVKYNSIRNITILGDFFLHPEEALEDIERGLINSKLDEDRITGVIQSILDGNRAVLIGASARDLAKAIMAAHQAR